MTIMQPGVSDSLRHATPRRIDAVAAGIVLLSGVSIAAAGPQPGSFASWYAGPAVAIAAPALGLAPPQDVAASEPAATMPADAAKPEEGEEDSKPAWLDPFSFEIVYTLTSDYIFRGLNLSEYYGEGREDPNHQLATSLAIDLATLWGRPKGECGSLIVDTFFEWYAGQDRLEPLYGAHNLQEFDFALSYAYEVKPLATTVCAGYVWYNYPNHHEIASGEWTVRLDHNDAWMWKWLWADNEDGVLNPYVAYWQDADLVSRGSWWQFGFSHDFSITEELVCRPSVDFGIDNHWIHPTLDAGIGTIGFANINYGLTLDYDVSNLLQIKSWGFGAVTLSGFIFYSDAVGNPRDDDLTADWLYGGMSVGWSF